MGFEFNVQENIAEWSYDKLHVLGLIGNCVSPLENLSKHFKHEQFEFAPVKNERNRDFLAGFHFKPAVDITVVRANGESSIVNFSLNREKSRDIADRLSKSMGLIIKKPYRDFILDIEGIMDIEVEAYHRYDRIASIFKVDIDKAFGVVRYSNFLQRYKNYNEEDSMRYACQMFDVKF